MPIGWEALVLVGILAFAFILVIFLVVRANLKVTGRLVETLDRQVAFLQAAHDPRAFEQIQEDPEPETDPPVRGPLPAA
jgi:hypothetical protein